MSEKSIREVLSDADVCVTATACLLERINDNENGFQDYLGRLRRRRADPGQAGVNGMLVDTNVSEKLLISRINRKLTKDSETLKGQLFKGSPSFGHFYSVTEDIPAAQVAIDIEKLGRELGVLLPGETLVG